MKLRFTPRAAQNIKSIAAYIRRHDPAAAERVRASIRSSMQSLLLFPDLGRPQKAEDVRKLVTSKYRYLVFYRIDRPADEIIVLNIKHPAQWRDDQDA